MIWLPHRIKKEVQRFSRKYWARRSPNWSKGKRLSCRSWNVFRRFPFRIVRLSIFLKIFERYGLAMGMVRRTVEKLRSTTVGIAMTGFRPVPGSKLHPISQSRKYFFSYGWKTSRSCVKRLPIRFRPLEKKPICSWPLFATPNLTCNEFLYQGEDQ